MQKTTLQHPKEKEFLVSTNKASNTRVKNKELDKAIWLFIEKTQLLAFEEAAKMVSLEYFIDSLKSGMFKVELYYKEPAELFFMGRYYQASSSILKKSQSDTTQF